jgi:hypothetical protein
LAIFIPISGDLFAFGGKPGVLTGGLDFDYPTIRYLAGEGFGFGRLLKLFRGEQASVRQARSSICQADDAPDFGL